MNIGDREQFETYAGGLRLFCDYHDGDGDELVACFPDAEEANAYFIDLCRGHIQDTEQVNPSFTQSVATANVKACREWMRSIYNWEFSFRPLSFKRRVKKTLEVMEDSLGAQEN